jgi:hypothetical protein
MGRVMQTHGLSLWPSHNMDQVNHAGRDCLAWLAHKQNNPQVQQFVENYAKMFNG